MFDSTKGDQIRKEFMEQKSRGMGELFLDYIVLPILMGLFLSLYWLRKQFAKLGL